MTETKVCDYCRQPVSIKEFRKNQKQPGGLNATCDECLHENLATFMATVDAEQLRKRRHAMLRQRFRTASKHAGISVEEVSCWFEERMVLQGGSCAICQRSFASHGRPCIDHCHRTGKLRSVLCDGCNSGLGQFGEDPTRLVAAIAYLRDHAS